MVAPRIKTALNQGSVVVTNGNLMWILTEMEFTIAMVMCVLMIHSRVLMQESVVVEFPMWTKTEIKFQIVLMCVLKTLQRVPTLGFVDVIIPSKKRKSIQIETEL